MKNLKTSALIMTSTLLLSSCATIFTGNRASININGQQDEPVNITTYDSTYQQVKLPYIVKIYKKKLKEKISVTSEHYKYQDFIPGRKMNPWIFGNIALGGVIGVAIDALTGAFYDAENKTVNLQYTPKNTNQMND